MTTAERNSQTLEIEKMYVDVGATSREEVENVFGIHIGDPMMPDVTFEYDAEHEICFGKAFDNRAWWRVHRRYDETAGKGAGFSCS